MVKEKIACLQWLRCFGAVAVVAMHLCADAWRMGVPGSREWAVLTVYGGLVRFPVPLFVMISGALFLGRERPVRELLGKYVLRIAVAYIFWSGVYTVVNGGTLRDFLLGHYHLWYLWLICGLYLISPFLGRIARDEGLCRYFLVLSLLFGNVLPRIADAAGLLSPELGELAAGLLGRGKLYFCMGYVCQFVLGYWLSVRAWSRRERLWLYALGILCALGTVFGTFAISLWKNAPDQLLFEAQSFRITAVAAALFVFARYHLTALPKMVEALARYSFGIYLLHPMVLEFLADRGLTAVFLPPIWGIPLLTAGVTGLCALVTALLARIPGVRNWLI